jgi:hypothetical protein
MATQKEDLKNYIKSINEKVPATVGESKKSVAPVDTQGSFSLLLNEIKSNNKISNGLTLDQLKLDKKNEEDTAKSKEQLDAVIKGLKDVNDTLKGIKKSSTGGAVSGAPVEGKGSPLSKGLPGEAKDLTITERLKSVVGGVKSAGNKFMEAGGNVVGAVTDTLADPGAAIKKAYGSSKGVIKGALGSAKDILSTKADYSVEQERFATAFSKTGRGGLMQGKKTGKEVGAEVYNKLKAKQVEIDSKKEELRPFEEQGFTPKGKTKELEKLKSELADIDPRVQKEDKKQEAKTRIDDVENKKEDNEVKAEKTSRKKASVEGKVSSKAEQDPSKVSAPSGSEDLLKEIKANNVTLGSLLSVTQTQLISINAIKDALAPTTPKELTEQKSAPSSTNEKEGEGGGSIVGDLAGAAGDLLGNGKGKAGKAGKGLGGKILGGLGKAAKFLGPAAAIAGAAYSGFEGYQNTGANFDLKEGEDATVGQKTASTLGGVASGLTFGLLDEKTAAQGIHKAGSAVKDFLGFGDKEKASSANTKETASGSTTKDSSLEELQAAREAHLKRAPDPETGSANAIMGHRRVLASIDNAIEAKKNSKPTEGKLSEATSVTPVSPSNPAAIAAQKAKLAQVGSDMDAKGEKLSSEATRLGIDPNNAIGTYEGGALTKITDKVSGKQHQIAVPEESKARVEAARNLKSNKGSEVAETSAENKDMEREASKGGGNNTVVSNNVNNTETTKISPGTSNPRPEYSGSALDRYQSRISAF